MTSASSSDNLFGNLMQTSEPAAAPEAPAAEPEAAPLEAMPSELDMLKNRAKLMGIAFSNNIGLEALKAKIAAKLSEEAMTAQDPDATAAADTGAADPELPSLGSTGSTPKPQTLRQAILQREMALVRLRITCLDPKKKDLPGEIFTVANEYLGTVRKFVPFGEVTDDGFHVPYCIYKALKRRQFLQIRTRKDKRTGTDIVEQNYVREFALEVLPQLTEAELAKLAAAQAAAGE